MAELPVVDLGSASVVEAVDSACADVGFFALVGHGLTDDDGRVVIEAARTVLAAGADEVDRLDVANDENFRGFERADRRLAFEIGRVGPCGDGRLLCGPNRWPDVAGVAAARAVLERHHARCTEIADIVVGHLLAAGHLGAVIEAGSAGGGRLAGGPAHLRVWRYPSGQVDLPAHADHGFLTLLLAPDPGLEIRDTEGEFFGAPPAGGEVLIVNVGRLLAHVSGGRYRATVHRVRSEARAERYSAPFFHAPNDDLAIAPPAEGQQAPRTVGEYVHWGYSWQRRVNSGGSVYDATDGAVEH